MHLFVPTHVAEWAPAVTDFSGPFFEALSFITRKAEQRRTPVPEITWESVGFKPRAVLTFCPIFFLQLCEGVAALSAEPLTRSGCGVGLIHLALCVCLEQTWLLRRKKKKVRRELLKPRIVWEKEWEWEDLPVALTNLSRVVMPPGGKNVWNERWQINDTLTKPGG